MNVSKEGIKLSCLQSSVIVDESHSRLEKLLLLHLKIRVTTGRHEAMKS